MRLQKFLSGAGACSRRQGEQYILSGNVAVNGEVVRTLGTKVDPEKDRVQLNGVPLSLADDGIYIALNKPRGYVTSCSQPGDKIVLDLVDVGKRIFPVGRLDRDSTGLLLLTNDGSLHHRLSHPSFDHEKEYNVTTERPISDGALRKLEKGIVIMGRKTRPAVIRRISGRKFSIAIKEGRNRQIRRMVGKVGGSVVHLRRTRFSGVRLGNLAEGAWRYLSKNEIKGLKKQSPK